MKATARWLVSNLPLMVMALALASLAWFVALEDADPTIEKRYPRPLQVTLIGPSRDMVVVGEFDERVQVTVRAPRSVYDSLEVGDFTVEADVRGLDEGDHTVPVKVTLDREPSRVVEVEPGQVAVELDSSTERTVPVHIQLEGKPALGYLRRSAILDPSEVTVIGPSSYVTRVVEAFARVSLQGADSDIETELQLRPRDDEGNGVPFVTLRPDAVDVRVPVEPSGYYRSLAVKVVLTGEVASGYRVTDISVDPPAVTVFGNPSVLDALQGFLETKPIDVADSQDDVVVQPGLDIPPNVAVVPGQQVKVRVFVKAIESSVTIEIAPEVQGMEPGLTATVSPDTVDVILGGPLPTLEKLETGDVRVVLDLFELPVGVHQMEPQAIVPEGVTAQSVIPATLQVEIAAMPSPTPTRQLPITVTKTITNGR